MKAKLTFVFAILFLATLALGLAPAQATPVFTSACVQVDHQEPASSDSAFFARLQSTRNDDSTTTAKDCLSFCSRVLCTEGNVCGPCANGGCGCHPSSGGA